jgi:hypothetical protein
MLTYLKYEIKVFAPSLLLQKNRFVDSNKRADVMRANVMRHCVAAPS